MSEDLPTGQSGTGRLPLCVPLTLHSVRQTSSLYEFAASHIVCESSPFNSSLSERQPLQLAPLGQPKRCRTAVCCSVPLHNRQPTDPSDSAPVGQDCGHPPLRSGNPQTCFPTSAFRASESASTMCISKKRSSAPSASARQPQTARLVFESLLSAGCAAKKRHGGLRRWIKEDRCRDSVLRSLRSSLTPALRPQTRPFFAPPPHRGHNPARSVSAVRPLSLVSRNIRHNLSRLCNRPSQAPPVSAPHTI